MKVFRKTGVSTLINILGMSVAFAAAMILLVRVYWDETYDRKLKGSEQVFRMEQDWSESGRFSVYFKRPLIERVRQMDPNIESVATMASWGNWTLAPEGNPGAGVSLSRAMVDETFFDVFPLTWLDGSVKEFATPSTVVLNRTMARTFFGDEPAVGKYLQNGDGTRFRVVGVYEDMPANSSIAHQSFINLGEQYLEDEGEWSFSAYLKLRDPKDAKATQARVTESLLEYFGGNAEDATDEDRDEFRREFRISNLHKAYFLQDANGQMLDTHSVSAGLDYSGVGPEHCYLADTKRAAYTVVTDEEAVAAFDLLCRLEGIIPALESSHAVAQAVKDAPALGPDGIIVVNLSGRGDKDMDNIKTYKVNHGQDL